MKALKNLFLALASLTFLFLSFSFYTYEKTVGDVPPGPPLQLSRIDFSDHIDTETGNAIRSKVKHLKGVDHTFYNHEDDILVFSHDPKTIKPEEVLNIIQETFRLAASRFVVDDEMKSSGCPITGSNTIFMKVGGLLHKAL